MQLEWSEWIQICFTHTVEQRFLSSFSFFWLTTNPLWWIIQQFLIHVLTQMPCLCCCFLLVTKNIPPPIKICMPLLPVIIASPKLKQKGVHALLFYLWQSAPRVMHDLHFTHNLQSLLYPPCHTLCSPGIQPYLPTFWDDPVDQHSFREFHHNSEYSKGNTQLYKKTS